MTKLKEGVLFFDEENIIEALEIACRRIGRPLKIKKGKISPIQQSFLHDKKFDDIKQDNVQRAVDFLIRLFLFYKRAEVQRFFHCRPRSTLDLPTGYHYEIINGHCANYFNHFISLRKSGIYWVTNWGENELWLDHRYPEDLTSLIGSDKKYQELVVDLQSLLLNTPEEIEIIFSRHIYVGKKMLKKQIVIS